MESSNTLHHMIYGCPIDSHEPVLLASSTDFPQSVVAEWRRTATVDAIRAPNSSIDEASDAPEVAVPFPQIESQAVGLFRLRNGGYLFARAAQDAAHRSERCPIYEYVQLSRSDLNAIAGNAGLLAEHVFYDPIPSFATPYQSLEPYRLPATPTWTFDRRVAVISHLVNTYGKGDLLPLLLLLSAALSDQQLVITGFPGTSSERLLIVQGLMLLLPVFARLEMTFTTNTVSTDAEMLRRVRIVFNDSAAEKASGSSDNATDRSNQVAQEPLPSEESEGVTLVSGSSQTAALTERTRWRVDFQHDLERTPKLPDWETLKTPYTEALERIWQKEHDPRALASEIRVMELSQGVIAEGEPFQVTLAEIAAAYSQDQRVMAGETLTIEQIHAALARISPANGDLYRRYMALLLEYGMAQREPEAAQTAAAAMDRDAELDQIMKQILQENLETQPDAVYFVIRTHLAALLAVRETSETISAQNSPAAEADHGSSSKDHAAPEAADVQGEQRLVPDKDNPDAEVDPETTTAPASIIDRWLPRLRQAALRSLEVASTDSDNETLLSWLRLIVREPAAYQLSDVLQNGIRAVQTRAYSDGQLGFQLLQITARRVPEVLDTLLQDETLVSALTEPLSSALAQYDPQAIQDLLQQSRILYLMTLTQAARAAHAALVGHGDAINEANGKANDEAQAADGADISTTIAETSTAASVLTPEVIEQIWLLYTEDASQPLVMQRYHPGHLLQVLLTEGLTWLPTVSMIRLLTLMLGLTADDPLRVYTPQLIHASSAQDESSLATALEAGSVPQENALNIVGAAVNSNVLTPQQAVDTYLQMLEAQAWNRTALPLAEQIVRTLQHHSTLKIDTGQAWKLLSLGSEARSELIARVMARRAFTGVEKRENEKELVEQFLRLHDLTVWNAAIRQLVMNQWREFCRRQTTTRLQQLDKLLEGRKPLEDARNILETVLALRRVFNKRSFEEFADAVAMTYSILQGLSDAFDPAPKHNPALDPVTLRQELDTRREELTPDERRVLAKNLKELNGLIALMNEHRSRATLIRREDELERQLVTGEYTPQSAMDMLKWLSGYLDDAHKPAKS